MNDQEQNQIPVVGSRWLVLKHNAPRLVEVDQVIPNVLNGLAGKSQTRILYHNVDSGRKGAVWFETDFKYRGCYAPAPAAQAQSVAEQAAGMDVAELYRHDFKTVERIDALAQNITSRTGVAMTRSDAVRVALQSGLKELEPRYMRTQ